MPLWSMRDIWVCDSNMSSKCVKLQLDSPQGPNPCLCKRCEMKCEIKALGLKLNLKRTLNEEDMSEFPWRRHFC